MNRLVKTRKCFYALLLCVIGSPLMSVAQVRSSMGQSFEVHTYENESIQFLLLHADKSAEGESIKLEESIIRPGRLKKPIDVSIHHHSSAPELVCKVLSAKGEVLLQTAMPDPFVESLEYVDEDSEQLQRKEVQHNHKDFSIRLPYKQEYMFLRIEKPLSDAGKVLVLGEFRLR